MLANSYNRKTILIAAWIHSFIWYLLKYEDNHINKTNQLSFDISVFQYLRKRNHSEKLFAGFASSTIMVLSYLSNSIEAQKNNHHRQNFFLRNSELTKNPYYYLKLGASIVQAIIPHFCVYILYVKRFSYKLYVCCLFHPSTPVLLIIYLRIYLYSRRILHRSTRHRYC